jgi:hypothetical protein
MENLPKHLFDSEYYYRLNPDVKNAGADAYNHYFQHGINEKDGGDKTRQRRDACLNFSELTLDQLRNYYYHMIPDDPSIIEIESKVGNIPFYLRNNLVSHLPILEYYASLCHHITEFGVRHGQSTVAFLYGLPDDGKLESYDIEETPFVRWLNSKNLSKWDFTKRNPKDKNFQIMETDLIFFNSHSYEQETLESHAGKARKFLVFYNAERTKVNEYLTKHEFKIVYKTDSCNGLIIGKI